MRSCRHFWAPFICFVLGASIIGACILMWAGLNLTPQDDQAMECATLCQENAFAINPGKRFIPANQAEPSQCLCQEGGVWQVKKEWK